MRIARRLVGGILVIAVVPRAVRCDPMDQRVLRRGHILNRAGVGGIQILATEPARIPCDGRGECDPACSCVDGAQSSTSADFPLGAPCSFSLLLAPFGSDEAHVVTTKRTWRTHPSTTRRAVAPCAFALEQKVLSSDEGVAYSVRSTVEAESTEGRLRIEQEQQHVSMSTRVRHPAAFCCMKQSSSSQNHQHEQQHQLHRRHACGRIDPHAAYSISVIAANPSCLLFSRCAECITRRRWVSPGEHRVPTDRDHCDTALTVVATERSQCTGTGVPRDSLKERRGTEGARSEWPGRPADGSGGPIACRHNADENLKRTRTEGQTSKAESDDS
jgi:hypothetical protein